MIFRQLFDNESCTYTYLLASRPQGEAILIDPVRNKVNQYLRLLRELDIRLVKTVDTHCHADHISGIAFLRDVTQCITIMGTKSSVDCVSMRVDDGDKINIEDISLKVHYTPGHTDDSYCFSTNNSIFTGDTLLIRGTGRTDFQNGDPFEAYKSLFKKVLKHRGDTIIYPGHDYNGNTKSTIAEEIAHNPRLQVSSAQEYAELMNNLNLPNPKMMDQAIPANLNMGFSTKNPKIQSKTITPSKLKKILEQNNKKNLLIDLREVFEREKKGIITPSINIPYSNLSEAIKNTGKLARLIKNNKKTLITYCAYGERSALALSILDKAGFKDSFHLGGGINSWIHNGGAVSKSGD